MTAPDATPREFSTISLEVAGGLATLTMNRPDRKNAMNYTMIRETREALTAVAADRDIAVLVLTGSGDWFCPGGDIRAVVSGEIAREKEEGVDLDGFQVPVILHEMPQVTVAAINGPCAGAGLGWALGCDLRFATASAKFATAFLERGIAGDMSLPWSLPRVVGGAEARQLSFLPSKIDARRALEISLVTEVFDDETFVEQVDDLVQRLVRFNPEGLRSLKRHYVAAERMSFADYAELESRIVSTSVDPAAFATFLRPER